MYCRKCGNQFEGKFCPNCGEPAEQQESVLEQTNTEQPQPAPTYQNVNYSANQQAPKQKLGEKTWFVVLTLILFWPVGLFCMWKNKKFNLPLRIIITVVITLLVFMSCGKSDTNPDTTPAATVKTEENSEPQPLSVADSKEESKAPEETISASDANTGELKDNAASDETTGQQNAARSAKNYLDYSAFSYQGLIEQLAFENFSKEDATYGADNCGADWNEQATKCAQTYLDYSAFSYEGLIKQLAFDKFTNEQATYGADNCNADWNEQSVKCAKSYLEYSAFSRDSLIEQLKFDGFTAEQAVHGAEANGY